jgi:tetratricopeptide (TPR) repeat protein/DNA-binding transcriptional ArsR family regulator
MELGLTESAQSGRHKVRNAEASMLDWDRIIRQAKDCHTKQAWESFFLQYAVPLASTNSAKPIAEIFRHLESDPHSLQYDPEIFAVLLKGCLAIWNLELGQRICAFCHSISHPKFGIAAAKLLLESGQPAQARQFASRSLRQIAATLKERLQLEVLICSSYTQEGRHTKAVALLEKLEETLATADLDHADSADLNTEIARMHYFRGQYSEAVKFFRQASDHYLAISEWEAATKSLFNTAVCCHNGADVQREEGFGYIERARVLAETHNFQGPLAHIEAFYGLDAFQHGNFAEAREHFRRSLEVLPMADKGMRRLHVLSMLALTYLASGRYHLARKFGRQTLDLAALDNSNCYKARYLSLEAELLWEDGHAVESQALLASAMTGFRENGIHTLEELSTYSRGLIQSALLGDLSTIGKIQIDQSLTRNVFNWLEYQKSEAKVKLTSGKYTEANEAYLAIESAAIEKGDRFHEAVSVLGQIESLLALKQVDAVLERKAHRLGVIIAQIGDTPLRTNLNFVHSAIAYNNGDFEACKRILRSASKSQKISFAERFVLNCWLATVEGRSMRLTNPWQVHMVGRFTRIYFAPMVEVVDDRHFVISDRYTVSLEKHPAIAEFISFLVKRSNYRASLEEIQQQVWHQSLKTQGWQQKIRNTIMRARDLFPYTIAPFILHQDDVGVFSDAIKLKGPQSGRSERESEIQRLLRGQPMTTQQLAERLRLSPATTKRTLRKMTDEEQLRSHRDGRNIYYYSEPVETPTA